MTNEPGIDCGDSHENSQAPVTNQFLPQPARIPWIKEMDTGTRPDSTEKSLLQAKGYNIRALNMIKSTCIDDPMCMVKGQNVQNPIRV